MVASAPAFQRHFELPNQLDRHSQIVGELGRIVRTDASLNIESVSLVAVFRRFYMLLVFFIFYAVLPWYFKYHSPISAHILHPSA